MQPERELDELLDVPPGDNGADLHGHGAGPYMADTTTDVFAKVHSNERLEQLRVARQADLVPYFRVVESPALPVVEMEGAERIMLGSNNYLGLTSDPRVVQAAHDALDRYGPGLTGSRLLNGTTPLHLELEEELAAWMGAEAAIVFTTGHQTNVGTLGTLLEPGDTVIADSADHASILDGCLLSRARLRPFRHGRLDKLEKSLQRAAEDGGGVLVVVDGVFSMEGDVAPLPEIVALCRTLRRAPHGRRGARRRRARRARRRRDASCSASRPTSTCAWARSRSRLRPAAASSPGRPTSSTSCARSRARSCSPRPTSRPPLGAALAALRIVASDEGPPLFARVLDNARHLERRAARARLQGRRGRAPGDVVTPIVPVLVEDDWKAALLWRALYDAGVFVNVALHPAVPPGGALLRTSVMATHDTATLDRALDTFSDVSRQRSRPNTARCRSPTERSITQMRRCAVPPPCRATAKNTKCSL